LLEALESNAPLSTRTLKELTDLQGTLNEAADTREMKDLFTWFLIDGFGEVNVGAFPSLPVGATESLCDELWREADQVPQRKVQAIVDRFMPQSSPCHRYFDKTGLARTSICLPSGLKGSAR